MRARTASGSKRTSKLSKQRQGWGGTGGRSNPLESPCRQRALEGGATTARHACPRIHGSHLDTTVPTGASPHPGDDPWIGRVPSLLGSASPDKALLRRPSRLDRTEKHRLTYLLPNVATLGRWTPISFQNMGKDPDRRRRHEPSWRSLAK